MAGSLRAFAEFRVRLSVGLRRRIAAMISRIHRIVLIGLAFCLSNSSGFSGESPTNDWDRLKVPSPKGYVCYRAMERLQIDGDLAELAWENAPWTDEFADIEGALKPKPRFRTRAKMLWDDEYFYIGAELEEPHVQATLTQHDSVIFRDNDFEVFIDPNGDNHEYYEIEINALNAEWDLFLNIPYKDGGTAQNEWEIPGLKSAVHIQGTLNNPRDVDQGWSVEMAIPWRVLAQYARRPAPPQHGDQWRINFSRVEWRSDVVENRYRKMPNQKEDNWVWSPQGLIDMHRPEKWGSVQFSTDLPGQTSLRPDPAARIRDLLMEFYYAQRAFHARHKRWARSREEVGWESSGSDATPLPSLRITKDGFVATADFKLPSGQSERWSITQESRLRKE